MIVSHISKLLAPVIASIPLSFLKLILFGTFTEFNLDNSVLVTQEDFLQLIYLLQLNG